MFMILYCHHFTIVISMYICTYMHIYIYTIMATIMMILSSYHIISPWSLIYHHHMYVLYIYIYVYIYNGDMMITWPRPRRGTAPPGTESPPCLDKNREAGAGGIPWRNGANMAIFMGKHGKNMREPWKNIGKHGKSMEKAFLWKLCNILFRYMMQ